VRPDAPPPATTTTDDPDALLCPACGYDLRGTSGDRCSECGATIDRLAPQSSNIPWTRRKVDGRVKTFVKTLWRMTRGGKSLRLEHRKAHDPVAARRFAVVVGVLLGAALAGAFVAGVVEEGGHEFLAVRRSDFERPALSAFPFLAGNRPGGIPARLQDALVPWSAGAMLPGVMPVVLLLMGLYLTLAPRALFRLKGARDKRRIAAEALASYAVAPLAWLLPAIPCFWAGVRFFERDERTPTAFALLALSWVFELAALSAIFRIAQWSARTKEKGAATLVLTIPALLCLWALGVVLFAGVLPWCVGFFWIVIDSLR
jgi:hypothetical protein